MGKTKPKTRKLTQKKIIENHFNEILAYLRRDVQDLQDIGYLYPHTMICALLTVAYGVAHGSEDLKMYLKRCLAEIENGGKGLHVKPHEVD